MTVLVLGASGIIGTHMRLCKPDHVKAIYHRRKEDGFHLGLTDIRNEGIFDAFRPSVIVNLSGEAQPDLIERDSTAYEEINVELPAYLAKMCQQRGVQFIQVSTQAVFGGDQAPYGPDDPTSPLNAYGEQKRRAEIEVLKFSNSIVARPTFILGVRPLPHVGRTNPVEQILGGQPQQVCDRYFSPCFARDAAEMLWALALYGSQKRIVHLGNPIRMTRHAVAQALGMDTEAISHNEMTGLAPRALDTTYAAGETGWKTPWEDGISQLKRDWQGRKAMDAHDRAIEIALFLGITETEAETRLQKGFGYQHGEVAADWRRANPRTDEEILEWYRTTETYCWELSAYHADRGFNYAGMCQGISERLKAAGAKRVLCLGDGIGDLTLALHRAGFEAIYHDLEGSRTAEFAKFRFWRHTGEQMKTQLTGGWAPAIANCQPYDAVVSLDFMEHVDDVPSWTAAVKNALIPGGLFCAQNAFGLGSGENGSIPCHLARNDRFEKDWDPLLADMGFKQESSNWYRRAA
jgi:dTDP-4-dehydrorhamnose reductase